MVNWAHTLTGKTSYWNIFEASNLNFIIYKMEVK